LAPQSLIKRRLPVGARLANSTSGGNTPMTVLRYLLFATGAGLAAGALTILAWDLYEIFRLRKRASEAPLPPFQFRLALAGRLAALSIVPWLAGWSIALVPSGTAGGRRTQITGTRPRT